MDERADFILEALEGEDEDEDEDELALLAEALGRIDGALGTLALMDALAQARRRQDPTLEAAVLDFPRLGHG